MNKTMMIVTAVTAMALSTLTTGCKTPAMTQAIVQTTVATGVALGVQKSPQAVPYLKAATPVVCAAASGTNISPAEVVAAIEAANLDSLKTPEAVIIMNGALSLYMVIYDEYGTEAINQQAQLRAFLQGTCNGLNIGLLGRSSLKNTKTSAGTPHIR